MPPNEPTEGISRRQALKRVAAAGAVMWATPVIQTISASRAYAQTISPVTNCYRVKVEEQDGFLVCETGYGNNDCLPPGPGVDTDSGCELFTSESFVKLDDYSWSVALPPGCLFVQGFSKGGPDDNDTPEREDCWPSSTPAGSGPAVFFEGITIGDITHGISHVELEFCCT